MLARIARNTAAQAVGLALTFADRFVVVGVLLRAWGPQLYSDWAALLSCAGLIAMGELGLNIYYGNTLQKAWTQHDTARFQRTVSIALFISGCLAILLGGIAISIASTVDLHRGLSIGELSRAEAYGVLALLGWTALSRVARGSISQTFRGRQQFATGTMVDLTSAAATVTVMLAAGLLGARPLTLAMLMVASDLLAGWGFMLFALKSRYRDLRLRPSCPTATEFSDVIGHVKWLAVQQGSPVAWLQLPIVYLGAIGWSGPPLVGFVLSRTLVNFMRTLCNLLSIGSGVEIAAVHHAGQTAQATRHVYAVARWLAILATAMAAGLLLFGRPFVSIWSGHDNLFNPILILFLASGAVLAAPAAAISSHLMLANAPRPISLALIFQLAVGLPACAAMARAWGPTGAAAGLAVAEAAGQGLLIPILAARQMDGFEVKTYLSQTVRAIALTGGWTFATGFLILHLIDIHSTTALIAAVLLWGFFALLPVFFAGLSSPQRSALLSRVTKLRNTSTTT